MTRVTGSLVDLLGHGPADVYKALPGATYGGEEEAGGLLSKSHKHAGSLLPCTVQASSPSWEGPIIRMLTQLSQASQRRKR